MDKLKDMGAINISDTFMKDRKGNSDKIRYLFQIEDQAKALDCYKYFIDRHSKQLKQKYNPDIKLDDDLGIKQNVLIYLQKTEDVFVKYGDIEADLYYEAESMKQKMKQEEEERRRAEGKRDNYG